MADKRGNWSKSKLREIWKEYIDKKIWRLKFNEKELEEDWDLNIEAPCPYEKCLQKNDDAKKMLKSQYEGWQKGKYQWSVDHIDDNPNNNNLNNLWPMHPKCNKNKSLYKNK